MPDIVALGRDAFAEVLLTGPGRIVVRLCAEEIGVEIEAHGMAGDAQIVEAGAEEGDVGYGPVEGMLGRDLSDNAIRGDDIEDVEVLEHRGGQGYVTVAWLAVQIAGDLGVGSAKGNHAFEVVIARSLGEIASALRKIDEGLGLDFGAQGKLQIAFEGESLRVVDMLIRN